jgi:hypothetical protein
MTPRNAPTRIEAARHRADGAKKVAAVTAAVAFAAVVLLARASHSGDASTSSRATARVATAS